MNSRQTLIEVNVGILEQGVSLLAGLEDELYAKPEPAVSSSGIGSHFRHVIDYYGLFLAGVSRGRVDYDERERDPRLETGREHARRRLRALTTELRSLATSPGTGTVEIKMDATDGPRGAAPWSASTIERELQFLLSHTVHHYALVAVILRLNGRSPAEGFGVAPSTLRYWEETRVHADLDPR